jgi:hypothetical protein
VYSHTSLTCCFTRVTLLLPALQVEVAFQGIVVTPGSSHLNCHTYVTHCYTCDAAVTLQVEVAFKGMWADHGDDLGRWVCCGVLWRAVVCCGVRVCKRGGAQPGWDGGRGVVLWCAVVCCAAWLWSQSHRGQEGGWTRPALGRQT